jgi:hypothetical protein
MWFESMRRGLAAGRHAGLAAPAMSMGGAAGAGGRVRALDFSDPRDNVYCFGKLWGSYDEPVYTAYHGTNFALIGDARLQPVFGYTGFGIFKCTQLEGGHVRIIGKECALFTDLATGEVMETWKNPWSGHTVEVYNFFNPALRATFGLEMPVFAMGSEHTVMNAAGEAAAIPKRVPFLLPFEVMGDRVLLTWEYIHRYRNPLDPAVYPRESTGAWISPAEQFMFSASYDELADRSLPSARFHAGFFRVGQFWPWMLMGDTRIDGHLTARCHSYKLKPGTGNIPPKVLAWCERNNPEFLEPPVEGPDTQPRDTWMGYRLERRPVPPLPAAR